MAIPERCTVLVMGGGPSGSFAASALAREGIHTVVLEAEHFPRYHIGESMLPSLRHYLRFVELDSKFDAYGFQKKTGAAFKLNPDSRPGHTDFIAAGGPDNYAWNVVRSEADNIFFQHARDCGALVFDGVKVSEIQFQPDLFQYADSDPSHLSNPVSASWLCKSDGSSGTIKFDFLVDATGRSGLISNKYLRNRKYNQSLKNIATWGYWRHTMPYVTDSSDVDTPFFEALQDETGWAWKIPLHNGTSSVGIVMNQECASERKRSLESSSVPASKQFYLSSIKRAPGISRLLAGGELVTDLMNASDYSYSSSHYATPFMRIVGDAGCFIDPLFSSGIHLALSSGLSAAVTIAASIKHDCDEAVAAEWHSAKVAKGYSRFLLIVLSVYRQMQNQSVPVLQDFGEGNFDRAFDSFRPVIQGTTDTGPVSQDDLLKTIEFCTKAFTPASLEEKRAVKQKLVLNEADTNGASSEFSAENNLSREELRIYQHMEARRLLRTDDTVPGLEELSGDVINGYQIRLERGALGLMEALV